MPDDTTPAPAMPPNAPLPEEMLANPAAMIRDSGVVDSGPGNPGTPESSSSSSSSSVAPGSPPSAESAPPSSVAPDPLALPPEPEALSPQPPPLPDPAPGTADSALPPQNPEPTNQNRPPAVPAAGPVLTVDPATLAPHPYANLLPLMSEAAYRRLKDAIALDGQQVPAQVYAGQLLDGRNRARACRELGIALKVEPFVGTDQTALVYVLSVNQHRREMSQSQRAGVAAKLLPLVSEDVLAKRVARITATQRQKHGGEIVALVPQSPPEGDGSLRSRAIVADIMGVSARYVGDALGLQRDAPELFEQVCLGRVTLKAALRQAHGTAGDGLSPKARALRQRVTALLRDPARTRDFSARLAEVVEEFEGQ